jgi:hypothetical protein
MDEVQKNNLTHSYSAFTDESCTQLSFPGSLLELLFSPPSATKFSRYESIIVPKIQ